MAKMRFSQRKGITPVRVEIQRESMDEPLRNKLWSTVIVLFSDLTASRAAGQGPDFGSVMRRLWVYFFKQPLDGLPRGPSVTDLIRSWFFKWDWYEVYDFVEALAQELEGICQKKFIFFVNSHLESEMSAYRFVGDEIGEFTSTTEIEAIEGAIADTHGLQAVQAHLREALVKLTDRKSPDYRNSIKESISAVEAMCQLIVGERATLGDALKKLKDVGVNLHPALVQAWGSLYGFTSQEGGIRHALSGLPNVTFGEAKYMLVSCSAFVSYVLDLTREAGTTLGTP